MCVERVCRLSFGICVALEARGIGCGECGGRASGLHMGDCTNFGHCCAHAQHNPAKTAFQMTSTKTAMTSSLKESSRAGNKMKNTKVYFLGQPLVSTERRGLSNFG